MRCKAKKADGSPCRAPSELVDSESGLCATHDPAKQPLLEAGRLKGGATTSRKAARGKALATEDLPPLRHPRDAEVWAEAVARAVGAGRLPASAGNTVLRALKSWMEARGAGALQERLEAFERAFVKWRETGDPAPVLDVIEGGASG